MSKYHAKKVFLFGIAFAAAICRKSLQHKNLRRFCGRFFVVSPYATRVYVPPFQGDIPYPHYRGRNRPPFLNPSTSLSYSFVVKMGRYPSRSLTIHWREYPFQTDATTRPRAFARFRISSFICFPFLMTLEVSSLITTDSANQYHTGSAYHLSTHRIHHRYSYDGQPGRKTGRY